MSTKDCPGVGAGAGRPRLWRVFAPWLVLPAALAVIALVDWLKHARERAPRKEAV